MSFNYTVMSVDHPYISVTYNAIVYAAAKGVYLYGYLRKRLISLFLSVGRLSGD